MLVDQQTAQAASVRHEVVPVVKSAALPPPEVTQTKKGTQPSKAHPRPPKAK